MSSELAPYVEEFKVDNCADIGSVSKIACFVSRFRFGFISRFDLIFGSVRGFMPSSNSFSRGASGEAAARAITLESRLPSILRISSWSISF